MKCCFKKSRQPRRSRLSAADIENWPFTQPDPADFVEFPDSFEGPESRGCRCGRGRHHHHKVCRHGHHSRRDGRHFELVDPQWNADWQPPAPPRPRPSLGRVLGAAVVAGALSGVVKLGWEVLFPPRTVARDATTPPQKLLQQLGFSEEFTHQTYEFSGHRLPWVSFLMHFGFSTTFSLLYLLSARRRPSGKGRPIRFGLAVWAAFHLLALPALGTIPAAKEQSADEHASEALGHVVWAGAIETVRRALLRG